MHATEAIKSSYAEMNDIFDKYLAATEEWMFRHAYQCGYEAAMKAMQKGGAAHEPKPEKMQQKEQYFTETGLLQSQIILDSRGNLIDGYTSYLLAMAHGIQYVPIRYGKRQIVRASHKPGGKLYTWELPGILIDRVSAGDKVLIHTQRGVRVVTVAAVEEYAGNVIQAAMWFIR